MNSSLLESPEPVEYGSLLKPSSTSAETSSDNVDTPDIRSDETKAAHELLENEKARFSPKCIFEQEAWSSGTATIGNEVLNLVKNIVGSGGLSLPAGIGAWANAPSALCPALVLIAIMGLVNAYSFSILGRVCAVTKSKTYQEAWDRSVGRRYGTKFNVWIGLIVTGKAVLGCWSMSIVIASTCQPLLQGLIGLVLTKAETLLGITILVLLPLCLSERLSSLAGFSIIGQIGTLVTMVTMTLRYFDGSYRVGGKYYDDIIPGLQPSFGDKGAMAFFSFQSLILVSILSQGYVAHYNAPKYYYELRDHSTGRFNVVVNISFLSAGLTYMVVSSFGFLTFGENSSGFILDNYSYRDNLATVSRLGVAFSVIFAYPLLFLGGRDGWLSLMGLPPDGSPTVRRMTCILLLTIVTILAILLNDLTFVLSFSGATLSASIIYILPPMMFSSLVLNCTCLHTFRTNTEIKESQAMIVIGSVLGVSGAAVTVVRSFFS